jgi:hypothetical protein
MSIIPQLPFDGLGHANDSIDELASQNKLSGSLLSHAKIQTVRSTRNLKNPSCRNYDIAPFPERVLPAMALQQPSNELNDQACPFIF